MTFTELLQAQLVEERGHTVEDAKRLMVSYPHVVVNGIILGNSSLRATAMALEMKDSEGKAVAK